jgi:hypothetical protein
MQSFVNATTMALDSSNWYAALVLALTIPDICGRLENPSMGSQARFVNWYDRFLLTHYQSNIGSSGTLHTFLDGSDCYALRCAFLHQGEFDISDQRAKKALENFHFIAPRQGYLIHMNQVNNALQLQVDRFCIDVCKATEQWMTSVQSNTVIQGRIAQLASIG